jgi:molybdenum cofactor guanylyltransferase
MNGDRMDGRVLNRKRLTGAILAGGRSSRMGQPKQEIVLADGRMMIEHVADALMAACDQVVIVGRTAAMPRLRRVRDLRPGMGPLSGIEALLASGIGEQYLVCACDVPRITPELLSMLTERRDEPATVFRTRGAEGIEPLPMRISSDALPIVREQIDARRLSLLALMDRLRPAVIDLPAERTDELRNVNTPEELARLGVSESGER